MNIQAHILSRDAGISEHHVGRHAGLVQNLTGF